MKANELLKNILSELSSKRFKLAQATLDNGTVLEAEAFESGNEIFIVTEEERIPLPVGEYTMEDGSMLYVVEEGLISEIKSAGAESEEEVAEVAIEAEDETVEVEVPEEVAAPMEEIISAVVEAIAPIIEEIQIAVEAMREEMKGYKEKMSKQAAARPIKHNPSKPEPKLNFQLASGRAKSTIDRVMDKINNFK
tara:strand:- start:326 stop:907 length:582 start_codon:yes stop_codon:yes gene_type:complete